MTIIPLRAQDSDPDAGEMPDAHRVPIRDIRPPLSEADLALRLSESDPDALNHLVNWLWKPLVSYAYRLVNDRDVAMDIAQEACVRIWRNRRRAMPNALRAYVFRVVRNLALDHLKTQRTRSDLLRQHGVPTQSRPVTPEEALERAGVFEQVEDAIQSLPLRRREVFVLAYLKGLSYTEVADVLGIAPKTVHNQMSAALAELRKRLGSLIGEPRDRPGA